MSASIDSTNNDSPQHHYEAVQFVRQAIDIAARDPDLTKDGKADAVGICRVVLEVAADLYGVDGKEMLLEWNLGRSEFIGMVVERLIASDLAKRALPESSSAYEKLFDVSQPPETWALKWTNDE
jgi:uncharacterized repeat protein (TIGR04138 family)